MTDQEITETKLLDPENARAAVMAEAVDVIDGALAKMLQRELVSTGEVADLLLDVRMLLVPND